jgi:hypothetical protein
MYSLSRTGKLLLGDRDWYSNLVASGLVYWILLGDSELDVSERCFFLMLLLPVVSDD